MPKYLVYVEDDTIMDNAAVGFWSFDVECIMYKKENATSFDDLRKVLNAAVELKQNKKYLEISIMVELS